MQIPEDLRPLDTGYGIQAQGSDLILSVSFSNSDNSGSAIYDINDYLARLEKRPEMLSQMLNIETMQIENTQTDIMLSGMRGQVSDLTAVYEDFSGKGKLYILDDGRNFGVYICYYVVIDQGKDPEAAKSQAEAAMMSIATPDKINGESYLYYYPENKSFMFLVSDQLASVYNPLEDKGVMITLDKVQGGENLWVSFQQEDLSQYGFATAEEYLKKYAENSGHPDPQIKYLPYSCPFAFIESTYTDESGAERHYVLATYTPGSGIFYTIYAEGTEEQVKQYPYPAVLENMAWSFRMGVPEGY